MPCNTADVPTMVPSITTPTLSSSIVLKAYNFISNFHKSFAMKIADTQTHVFDCSFYHSPKLHRDANTLLPDSAPVCSGSHHWLWIHNRYNIEWRCSYIFRHCLFLYTKIELLDIYFIISVWAPIKSWIQIIRTTIYLFQYLIFYD